MVAFADHLPPDGGGARQHVPLYWRSVFGDANGTSRRWLMNYKTHVSITFARRADHRCLAAASPAANIYANRVQPDGTKTAWAFGLFSVRNYSAAVPKEHGGRACSWL